MHAKRKSLRVHIRNPVRLGLLAGLLVCSPVSAQQAELSRGSVVQTVAKLKPGEFLWAPKVAPSGPMLLVVNVARQRAILFRNGVPIGATTISTGRPGHSTPTGVFTVLEKHVEHYSSKYDNAPMPYMQRLTWYGIALHAGHLPGYPASHGCIRLPKGFAKLLYETTGLGMTVVVTNRAVTPRLAPTSESLLTPLDATRPADAFDWHPDRSAEGPVSIIISAADRKAVVLRNGVIIGSGPVTVEGSVAGTWAYTLRNVDAAGQNWYRLQLSATADDLQAVPAQEWQRFHAPEAFRRAVAGILAPGTTIVVTSDSLQPSAPASTVLESSK